MRMTLRNHCLGLLLVWTAHLYAKVEATSALTGPVSKEYCSPEAFDVSCDPGHVVLMRSAIYGRMRLGRCIGGVSLGCKSDVLSHMDKLCSGRSKCKVDVNDLEKVAQPCPKDYKAYLEAEYECVRAISTAVCDTQTFISLSEQKGYIVGQLGAENGRTSSTMCTFSIEVDQGQRVALYMYSIGAHPGGEIGGTEPSRGGSRKMACHDRLTVEEGTHRETTSLCDLARPNRQHHLYTSRSNSLALRTRLGRSQQTAYFLLQYKAVGCPDVAPPTNSWVERTGDDLVVRCNTTGDIWYLTCQGNQWVGQIGNCSHGVPGFGAVFGNGIPIQQGIALAVGVGILVGAIFGALLLLCVWTIKKGAPEPQKHAKRADMPPTKSYIREERTNYPALLSQSERGGLAGGNGGGGGGGGDTTVYEYTHVWDPRSQSLEKRLEKKVGPGVAVRGGPAYTADPSSGVGGVQRGRSAAGVGGDHHHHHHQQHNHHNNRLHLYETPKGVLTEDDAAATRGQQQQQQRTTSSSDTPVYFDLDPEMHPREKVERPQ